MHRDFPQFVEETHAHQISPLRRQACQASQNERTEAQFRSRGTSEIESGKIYSEPRSGQRDGWADKIYIGHSRYVMHLGLHEES